MDLCGPVADPLDHYGHVLHLILAGQKPAFDILGDEAGSLGSFGDIVDTFRYSVHMSGQSLHFGGLFRRTLGQGSGSGRDLFGAGGHISGRRAQLAHSTVQRIGYLVQSDLDLFKFTGVFMFQGKGQISCRDRPQLFGDLLDIGDIFPEPEGDLVEVAGQHTQLVAGLIADGLVQLALGDPGSDKTQFLDRAADDTADLDHHQEDQDQHGQDSYGQHAGCQLVQFTQDFSPGHIRHSGPVAVRDLRYLDICILIEGQPRFSARDLLVGIHVHALLQLLQLLSGDLFVTVADDGARPGIHQKDAAGILDLNVAHDLRDRIQIDIRCRYASYSSVGGLQHTGGAYDIGLAVFVKIHIPQDERVRLEPILIPALCRRVKIRSGHKGGVVQGAVRQRYIQAGGIGLVFIHGVSDIVHHSRDLHVLVLDGIALGLQHGQRAVHPGSGLLEGAVRRSLQQILAFVQQCV